MSETRQSHIQALMLNNRKSIKPMQGMDCSRKTKLLSPSILFLLRMILKTVAACGIYLVFFIQIMISTLSLSHSWHHFAWPVCNSHLDQIWEFSYKKTGVISFCVGCFMDQRLVIDNYHRIGSSHKHCHSHYSGNMFYGQNFLILPIYDQFTPFNPPN